MVCKLDLNKCSFKKTHAFLNVMWGSGLDPEIEKGHSRKILRNPNSVSFRYSVVPTLISLF